MRVFIAIELDRDIKEYIGRIQGMIKNYSLKGNFSRIENFHLTLRFIGEANRQGVEELKGVIDQLALQQKPFNFTLGDIGYFQSRNNKIVWIGVEKGKKELKSLFQKLEELLVKRGFPREARAFNPHITVGREIKLKTKFDDIKDSIVVDNIVVPVKRISLMESCRVKGKLTYLPVYVRDLSTS